MAEDNSLRHRSSIDRETQGLRFFADMKMKWILLRGLTRESRHWMGFPEAMAAAMPGAELVLLDLPGAGTENGVDSPLSIAETTDHVRAKFRRKRASGAEVPVGVIGFSLGGMVAMDWAHRYSGDFHRVVLLNASAGNLSPWHKRMRFDVLPRVAKALAARTRVDQEREILGITTRLVPDLDGMARTWAGFMESQPVTRLTFVRQLAAAIRYRAPGALPMPTLVLSSARDGLVHSECSRRLAEHFEAEHRIHPTAGHDLAIDDPAWTARAIADWCR